MANRKFDKAFDMATNAMQKRKLETKVIEAARKYMRKCDDDQWCPDGAEDLWFAVEALDQYESNEENEE